MGNGRKQTALWLVFVEGAALSLGIYVLLTVLLSALVVKAVLPEEGSFPAVAASCCLASFAGAMLSVRRSSWGSLASAMVSAAQAGDFWRACWAGAGGSGSAVRSAGAARPEKPLVNFTKNTDLSPAAETAATVGRSPAAGETAAANVGRRRFYVYKILSFFGAGEEIAHADFTKLT